MISKMQYQSTAQAIEKLLNDNAQSFAGDPNNPQNPIPPIVHQALRDHLYKGELPIQEFFLHNFGNRHGAHPVGYYELEQALIPAIGRWADHVKGRLAATYGHHGGMHTHPVGGSPFGGFPARDIHAGHSPFGDTQPVRSTPVASRPEPEPPAPKQEVIKEMKKLELTAITPSEGSLPPFCTYTGLSVMGDLEDGPFSYSYATVDYTRKVTDVSDLLASLVPQMETTYLTGTWTIDVTYHRLLQFPVSTKGCKKILSEVGEGRALREAERIIRENTFLHRTYVPLVNERLATHLRIARDPRFIVSVETIEDMGDMIERPESILPKTEDPQSWSRQARWAHETVLETLFTTDGILEAPEDLKDILRCPRIYTSDTRKILNVPIWEMTDDQRAKALKDVLARNTILVVPERAVITNHPDIYLQPGPVDLKTFGITDSDRHRDLEPCFQMEDTDPVTRIFRAVKGRPDSFQAMSLAKTVMDPTVYLLEPYAPRWFFLES